MRLVLLVSCLLPLASASSSRACIDDSDCVDLGHKFACFLYKCYNWNEPSPEHPNCRNDDDCLKISRGVKDACYRHWNLRAVNKGVCFSSYSLSPCDAHTDCYGSDSCCGMHCCPEAYFLQWKNFTCFSDQQCKTWMTGDKCCDNNRCCYKEATSVEEDVFHAEDYNYYDKVEEEEGDESHVEVTPKVDSVEEVEELEDGNVGSTPPDDDYVMETTERDPENITKEVNEIIESPENDDVENANEIIVTTEHKDEDDSDDDNEIPVLIEQDFKDDSDSQINVTESSEHEEDDESEEGEQLFNMSDYDYYDHDKGKDVSNESQEVHGANKTSNATDIVQEENYLNQGQVLTSDTEKQNNIQENEEIIMESTTNMEEHTVTDIPDDTTEGYQVVIMLKQEEKIEEDVVLEEEIYDDLHDNEEASKESIVILDNNTVWEEEITQIAIIETTESISTENELKPEDTTIVENYEVSSSTMEATIIEDGIKENSNENFKFIPFETNEIESKQENEIPEEVSEGKDTEEIISLTIKPTQYKAIKKMSGSSTFLRPILGQIMSILYVIKYLLNL